MEAGRWREVDRVFAGALDRPPEELEAFLDAECVGDPGLRRAVEELLAADARRNTGFLERPAGELLGLVSRDLEDARLGPYHLLRRLGGGGMGDVYLARREDEHYQQEVAVKILRSELQGTEALHRFLVERQILARLEHPNIARLYDGGSTEDGRPYLVMERVEGLPVDQFCDRHQLTVDQRLDLFRRICEAVQYAHRNLLVHRDLKPANILVTEAGEPKLLDFGIAKRLQPEAADDSRTRTGLRVLTPSYASPEQVKGEPITTASDVYSLGVLLYELLAGRSPYRAAAGLPHEIETAICEQEPERPSAALFRAGGPSPEEIARARGSRPQALRRRLRGDLDNVVLTALRKEPERRYGSVAQLAADLDNHLRSLPISARPDTLLYRGRKFLRRHRAGTAAAAAVLLLVLGFVASLVEQRRQMVQERDKARYALSFLVDTFKSADPYHTRGERLTAAEILDQGAERASRDLSGQPDVQAALMDAIGEVELGLGRYDRAEPLLRRSLALRRAAFGRGSLEAAESLEHLGRLEQARSAMGESEALLRQALAIQRRQLGGDDLRVAGTLNELGDFLTAKGGGGAEEAERLHREALSISRRVEGAAGPTVAESLLDLGKARLARGDYAAAERLSRQGLAIEGKVLGPRDPRFYRIQADVGDVLIEAGKFKEAEVLLRGSLQAQREILGPGHPDVTVTLTNLATALHRQERWAESEAVNREALNIVRTQFGPSHWLVDQLLGDLAAAVDAQGRLAEAIPYYEEALEIRRRNFGPESPQVAQILLLLAGAHRSLKRCPEALRFSREGLAILEKIQDPHLSFALREVGRDYLAAGQPAQAEPYLRRALEVRRRDLPRDHPDIATAEISLADSLVRLRRYPEAKALLADARAILSRRPGNQDRLGGLQFLEAKLRRLGQ